MNDGGNQRRLSAILAADVVGYTRLMEQDTDGTVAAWKSARSDIIDPSISNHSGRIVKHTGDGFLVEFQTVQDAVKCAIAMQDGLAESSLEFRMGINLGDIIDDGEDIHGEGVNIAARIEALAEPGGICISGGVFDQVRNRLDHHFEDMGEHEVKHVSAPIRVYAIRHRGKPSSEQLKTLPLALPDKPSIAVLPFDNMSGDPEQEYFADGIAEDVITALSRFSTLFVIARNSSFTYKGQAVDITRVAGELGVRYVVEGSVRTAGDRVRITAQLIDAASGSHLWAERYDRPIGDLFDLQDDITQMIMGVLVPALDSAERKRASRKLLPSLDAWEAYQRGLLHYYRPYSHDDHAEARRLFDRAIELDPGFADAYAVLGLMGVYAVQSGQSSYSSTRQETLVEAVRAAERAVQLEDTNALAHTALGRASEMMGNSETGIAECETAVELNPNLAVAHHELRIVLMRTGRYAEAISCFDKAIRLSPNDPSRWNFFLKKGRAQYQLGEYESAIGELKTAARLRPDAFWPHTLTAAALVGLGQMDEARAAVAEVLSRKPDFTLALLSPIGKHYHRDYVDKILDHLRKTGLPD